MILSPINQVIDSLAWDTRDAVMFRPSPFTSDFFTGESRFAVTENFEISTP